MSHTDRRRRIVEDIGKVPGLLDDDLGGPFDVVVVVKPEAGLNAQLFFGGVLMTPSVSREIGTDNSSVSMVRTHDPEATVLTDARRGVPLNPVFDPEWAVSEDEHVGDEIFLRVLHRKADGEGGSGGDGGKRIRELPEPAKPKATARATNTTIPMVRS
jgi:hypothetical protein